MPLDDNGDESTREEALLRWLLPLRGALLPRTTGRNFVITSRGFFGLAPLKTKPGDEVCILEGGNIPYVLRSVNSEELTPHNVTPGEKQWFFTIVGKSYVHGVSDGEWIKDRDEADVIEVIIG
jgi:hypothetical protein